MTMTPDREAFLRRLEARNREMEEGEQTQQAEPNPNEGLEQQVHRLLKANNLSSLVLDPLSMKALCGMMRGMNDPTEETEPPHVKQASEVTRRLLNTELDTGMTMPTLPTDAIPTIPAAAMPAKERMASNLFNEALDDDHHQDAPKQQQPQPQASMMDAKAGIVITNTMLLQQLQLQTSMIIEMQRRMDELTMVVQQLASQQLAPDETLQRVIQQRRYVLGNGPHVRPAAAHPAQPGIVPPVQLRVVPQPTLFSKMCKYVSDLLSRTSASKTAEVWRLFWILHQRHVRLDGRLFFKVIFMVSVLSAKMMNRKKNNAQGSFWSVSYKFYLIMTLVTAGFLIQSGYLEFLYLFFWKEGYPRRIYNGEVVDPSAWAIPAARVAAQPNANPDPIIGHENFLGGNIERAPDNRGLSGMLLDVVYLVGSFFLSILPMWKPAGVDRRVVEEERLAQQQQPGMVRAPQDLDDMAEEEEEDDDDGDEHQD
jgi:hypothetical protein